MKCDIIIIIVVTCSCYIGLVHMFTAMRGFLALICALMLGSEVDHVVMKLLYNLGNKETWHVL